MAQGEHFGVDEGMDMKARPIERTGTVDLHAVAWHIQKRSDLEELGIASMEIFLHTWHFYLMSVNRNPDEQSAFEKWTEWTHEEHLNFIAHIEQNQAAFIEIPLLPDDYCGDRYLDGDCLDGKVEWLKEKAAAHGIILNVTR